MARGIEIPLTINPRALVRGLKLTERGFENLQDEIRDTSKAGDKLEDSLEDNFRDVGKQAKKAGKDMNDGLEAGLDADSDNLKTAAGSLAGEVVDEFVENWGEAVRSGDYASAVRETLSQLGQIGGAIGGPAGAAIGGAAALALTVGFDKIMDTEGKARIKATTDSLFDEVDNAELKGREAGAAFARGYVEEVSIPGQVQNALGLDSAAEAGAEVLRIAEETGLAYGTVQQVIIGNKDALDDVEAQAEEVTAEAERAYWEYERMKGINGEISQQEFDKWKRLGDQADALNDVLGTGGRILSQNRENAVINRENARAIGDARAEAAGVRDYINGIRTPDFGPMAGHLAGGVRSAQDLTYWLGQAARAGAGTRIAGVNSVGGPTL